MTMFKGSITIKRKNKKLWNTPKSQAAIFSDRLYTQIPCAMMLISTKQLPLAIKFFLTIASKKQQKNSQQRLSILWMKDQFRRK